MTYCALLTLAILRDDYAALDRLALARMVGACQDADGGYVHLRLYAGTPSLIERMKDSRRFPVGATRIYA